jgi:hypothetical protein
VKNLIQSQNTWELPGTYLGIPRLPIFEIKKTLLSWEVNNQACRTANTSDTAQRYIQQGVLGPRREKEILSYAERPVPTFLEGEKRFLSMVGPVTEGYPF